MRTRPLKHSGNLKPICGPKGPKRCRRPAMNQANMRTTLELPRDPPVVPSHRAVKPGEAIGEANWAQTHGLDQLESASKRALQRAARKCEWDLAVKQTLNLIPSGCSYPGHAKAKSKAVENLRTLGCRVESRLLGACHGQLTSRPHIRPE
jgi:hypothetical protein